MNREFLAREIIFGEITAERMAQDDKFGPQDWDPVHWLAILMEEVGEAAQAAVKATMGEGGATLHDYRTEMVQVAAVAVSMLECFDRQEGPPMTSDEKRDAIAEANARLDELAKLGEDWDGYGSPPVAAPALETARKWAAVWKAWGMDAYPTQNSEIILESDPDMVTIHADGSCAVFDALLEGIEVPRGGSHDRL